MARDKSNLTERLELRADPDFLRQLDDWRRRQTEIPSRSNALRVLVEKGLAADKGRKAA